MEKWHGKRKLSENERVTRDYFARIRLLIDGESSSLPAVDNSLLNYALGSLSHANTTVPETVRSARFNDGSFLSFRLNDDDAPAMQYDLTYYDTSFDKDIPRMVSYRVVDYKNQLVRSEYSHNPFETHRLEDDKIRELAARAFSLLSSEANASTPWIHAYTPLELQQARMSRGVKTPRIAINPDLGEPYL